MIRATRAVTAIALTFAISALPVLLARCAASCEAHRDTMAARPSCHHATSMATHIAQTPAPCGHDHDGTTAISPQGSPLSGKSFQVTFAVIEVPATFTLAIRDRRALTQPSPGHSSLTPIQRSLSLRI